MTLINDNRIMWEKNGKNPNGGDSICQYQRQKKALEIWLLYQNAQLQRSHWTSRFTTPVTGATKKSYSMTSLICFKYI